MIYGVDIDYKAVTIASLTLTLSSLQHRDADKPLPNLVGRTLIHQNSLMNTVPFRKRDEAFAPLKREIAALRRAKLNDDASFEAKRVKLQEQVAHFAESTLGDQAPLLSAECLEINLPEVFFKADGILDPCGGFTCVVGNPPWETWKPNSDEFYSQYDSEYLALKNAKQKKQRQRQLQEKFPAIENRWAEYSARMAAGSNFLRDDNNFQYQSWTVDGRKTSSDLNLYKASVERFYQCMQEDGRMGILTPDNLATDLGSTGLRHLIFEQGQVEEYLSFENRLGIFEGIHRSYKFATLIMQRSTPTASSFKVFFYKHSLNSLNDDSEKLNYAMSDVHKNQELLSLVEPRTQAQFDVYHKMTTRFPLFGETKPFKLGNDFHRTNDSEYFTTDSTASIFPLYEGKTFDQFTILYQPTEYATTEGVMKKVDPDQKEWRIAIRDVASATNRRSVISTLLPPNAVSANTINVQKNAAEVSLKDKLFYVGVLNSYVIDYYLRLMISIHVNQFFVKQVPLPEPRMFQNSDIIVSLTKQLLHSEEGTDVYRVFKPTKTEIKNKNEEVLLAELNAHVAIEFGLSRKNLITLLQTFESPKHKKSVQAEAQRIINCYDNLKKTGITNE
ncbi:putative restriction [Lactiplantibacillus plantarum]|nr:putative restriction [Lactiplantibacillus plantarum]